MDIKENLRYQASMCLPTTAMVFNLRWLTILVFAAACICNENIKSNNYTGPYKTQVYNIQHSKRSSNGFINELCPGTESTHNTTCNKGQRFNTTTGECSPCPDNTFIRVDNHRCHECTECPIDSSDQYVILIWRGNATHGPEFGCEAGYYIERYKHHCKMPECSNCAMCDENEFLLQNCSHTTNAVCCEERDMVVEFNKTCKRKTTTSTPMPATTTSATDKMKCKTNFYVDNINNTCQPCPPNTYVDEDNHTRYSCLNCSEVPTWQERPSVCSAMGTGNSGMSIGGRIGIVVAVGVVIILVLIACRHKIKRCIQPIMTYFSRQERSEGNRSISQDPDNETGMPMVSRNGGNESQL